MYYLFPAPRRFTELKHYSDELQSVISHLLRVRAVSISHVCRDKQGNLFIRQHFLFSQENWYTCCRRRAVLPQRAQRSSVGQEMGRGVLALCRFWGAGVEVCGGEFHIGQFRLICTANLPAIPLVAYQEEVF